MPKEDEPEYTKLYNSIKKLFDKYNQNGKVIFEYRTQIVIGDI